MKDVWPKKEPRYLPDVIDQIISIIPTDTRSTFERLRYDLMHIKMKALYSAPEDMRRHWCSVTDYLSETLGMPTENHWTNTVAKIMRNEQDA